MKVLEVCEGTVEIPARRYQFQSGLTEVRIPASVRHIGMDAFRYCNSITTLHLSDGLRSIGEGAFSGCTGLANVHLPESLRSIHDDAFAGCGKHLKILFCLFWWVAGDSFRVASPHVHPLGRACGEANRISLSCQRERKRKKGLSSWRENPSRFQQP